MVLPPLVAAWAHAAHSNPSWLRGPLADYLASGGDPDDVDENGKPLLHIAVGTHSGSHEVYHMVRAVLAAGPRNVDIRWEGLTPLHIAITNYAAKVNVVTALLEAGASVDARSSVTAGLPHFGYHTPVGSTPLMLAVTVTPVVGTMDHCVRILLSHGARLDLRRNGEDLESIARRAHDDRVSQMASTSQGHENWDLWLRNKRLRFATSMALLADVRAAGGTWAGYRHAPRLQLDVLRELCARDRAVPPSTLARTRRRRPGQLLARLFGDLPTDVFRHVLRFWRSGREEGISWK
mmetsp:Transcript_18990/g.54233  ORF Transcript_18990/g.54233 Transcript_18990/m.54233 type:complete len:293 (+) Transcript_18990:60-938(+)